MKSSLFTIFLITISVALISVCSVSAADADNIDLGDTGQIRFQTFKNE